MRDRGLNRVQMRNRVTHSRARAPRLSERLPWSHTGHPRNFSSIVREQFKDAPHVAGQRSNYLRNQAVTPSGRRAALFSEKALSYNGYYLWFSTIHVQAPAFADVLPNAWKGPYSLYLEAKAAGRSKFELQFPRGRWLKVMSGDLARGTLEQGPVDSWLGRVTHRHLTGWSITA
jgi:hypothetical protein